ncbi:MAG: exosortase-associated EpsI family protein [Victivallales bacterium]|nr:exosortase-associated EpsI family protein [Victivallales bacterium]
MKRSHSIVLLCASFLPFLFELPYCFHAMRISSAERWNWGFGLWAILLAALAVFFRLKTSRTPARKRDAGESNCQTETCRLDEHAQDAEKEPSDVLWRFASLVFPLFLLLFGYARQIHLAILLGGISLPFTLAGCLFGWRNILLLLPSCCTLVLFCPSVGILLSALLNLDGVLLKLLCALGFLVLLPCLLYCKKSKINLEAFLFSGIALIVAAGYWMRSGAVSRHPALLPVFDGLVSPHFRGVQESVSAADRQFFGDSDVKRFLFNDQNGNAIQVLVVSRIDNVHQVHPTAYCLRVGGFQMLHEHAYRLPQAGEAVEVLETLGERSGEKRLFWQWFSNSSYSTSNFMLFRTLYSSATDWSVFIVDMPFDGTQEEGQEILFSLISEFTP